MRYSAHAVTVAAVGMYIYLLVLALHVNVDDSGAVVKTLLLYSLRAGLTN